MAGESPDKSEQRKSPGATTSGTSDPRLAVFRAVPDPEAASVSGSQSGDARLRAAVAAWVATADSPSGDGATEVPETRVLPQPSAPEDETDELPERAGSGTDGESTRDGSAGDEEPDAGPAPADGDSGAADGPAASDGAGDTAEAAADDPSAEDGAKEASAGPEARTEAPTDAPTSDDEPEARTGSSPADAEPEGAVDAGAVDRPEAEADAEPAAGSGEDAGAGAESVAVAHTDSGPAEPDAAAKDDAGDTGDAGADAAAGAERDAETDTADVDDAAGAGGPDAESHAAADAESDEDDAAAEPDAGAADAERDAEHAADADTDDADAASGSDDGPRVADGPEGDTDDAAPAEGASGGDGGGGAGTDAGESTAPEVAAAKAAGATGATRAGGVDQPTGIFRRPKQPVDQPTTALKRSTFLPLRPDDVPADTKKPAPKPPQFPAPASPAPRVGATALPEPVERTRQQPLPPKPPLDLLAELTNTPPRPQTPVRTVLRRFKIWTPLALILVIVFAIAQAVRPLPSPTLGLTAAPTYTFKGGALNLPWPEEGQSAVEVDGVGSLGTQGTVKPAPTASMAKVMTAYVVLRDHPLSGKQTGPKIAVDKTAGDEANSPDESTAPIKEGQHYTEKQMLELLMIPSGNNAARLLSRWDGPTKDFVKKMNDAAADLGMKNSTYTDPSGLTATTVSTATDQLKLARAVMRNDVFREIVNTPQIDIQGIPNTIYNNNRLLLKPGVSGVKTGSSTPAGGNLLWAADTIVDGKSRRIVGVVMGQTTGATLDSKLQRAIDNSYKLIQAAQQDVTSATVVKKGDVVGYVDDGLGGKTPVIATKNLKAIGWPGLRTNLKIGEGGRTVPHSAKAGTVVGEVTVGSGPGMVTAPVALQQDLAEPGFGDKLTRLG